MTGTQTHFSDRELATVLAALRYWQQDLDAQEPNDEESGPISPHFDEHEPLSSKEVDELCQRLNTGATDPGHGPYIDLCRRVVVLASNWADGTQPAHVAVRVFRDLGQQARLLLDTVQPPVHDNRYVLYDFDADELVSQRVYDCYDDAADEAELLNDVLIVRVPIANRRCGDGNRESISDETCDCEQNVPGTFCSGIPGILARIENGRVVPGTIVERCDACERYESDEAALQKLIELGIAAPRTPADALGQEWTGKESND